MSDNKKFLNAKKSLHFLAMVTIFLTALVLFVVGISNILAQSSSEIYTEEYPQVIDLTYEVVVGRSINSFEEKVSSYMKDGWKLQGGVCVVGGSLLQVMVRGD